MDESTAKEIIAGYLAGQRSDAEFEQALNFLRTSPKASLKLDKLYRDMGLVADLSHGDVQEIMPYYLEPLARSHLPRPEREGFVVHLSQCPSCTGIYLELSRFEAEANQFRQDEAQPAQPEIREWPSVQPYLQRLLNSSKALHYTLSFNPVTATEFKETGAYYLSDTAVLAEQAEYKVVFEDTLDEDAAASFEATVTAWRSGREECDLQVELSDRLGYGRQAGQTVNLDYNGQHYSRQTDQNGEAVFPGLKINHLPDIKLDIAINL